MNKKRKNIYVKKDDLKISLIATILSPMMIFGGIKLFDSITDINNLATFMGNSVLAILGVFLILFGIIAFISTWWDTLKKE